MSCLSSMTRLLCCSRQLSVGGAEAAASALLQWSLQQNRLAFRSRLTGTHPTTQAMHRRVGAQAQASKAPRCAWTSSQTGRGCGTADSDADAGPDPLQIAAAARLPRCRHRAVARCDPYWQHLQRVTGSRCRAAQAEGGCSASGRQCYPQWVLQEVHLGLPSQRLGCPGRRWAQLTRARLRKLQMGQPSAQPPRLRVLLQLKRYQYLHRRRR